MMSTEAASRTYHLNQNNNDSNKTNGNGSSPAAARVRLVRKTERRNLASLILASVAAVLLAWLGVRSASALFGSFAGMAPSGWRAVI